MVFRVPIDISQLDSTFKLIRDQYIPGFVWTYGNHLENQPNLINTSTIISIGKFDGYITHWESFGYIYDVAKWTPAQIVGHVHAVLQEKVSLQTAAYIQSGGNMDQEEKAAKEGAKMGYIMTSFARSDIPQSVLFDLGCKLAKWDGFQAGELMMAYCREFMAQFAEYKTANSTKQLTMPVDSE